MYERLMKCYKSFQKKINFKPQIALVLGSGLGEYAEKIQIEAVLDYKEIEQFPISTVNGHKGRFIFGYVGGIPVVIMQGRIHYYEGYTMEEVVLPIRLMKLMGAEILFLTNAAGGVNYNFHVGDFMMIIDQIANFVPSPLIGKNIDELGIRFPDMSHIYQKDLCEIIRKSADELKINLQEGVYLQTSGPNFETPAEVKMCRVLGADAVGMSTACEAIAANHMGMKVCGISCISNLACGMSNEPLSDDDVKSTANRVGSLFESLVSTSISNMKSILDKKIEEL